MPLPPDLSKPAFSIFPQAADRVMSGLCVTCDSTRLRGVDFRDDISRKEYGISGMCQKCQDDVYGVEPDWDDVEEMFE